MAVVRVVMQHGLGLECCRATRAAGLQEAEVLLGTVREGLVEAVRCVGLRGTSRRLVFCEACLKEECGWC